MKAISPLIGFVLVIAFGFIAMTVFLTVVIPMLDRARDQATINDITQSMQLLNSVVKTVASESNGSKRTIALKLTAGSLRTNSTTEWLYFDFEPKSDISLDGFAGDIRIETKPVFLEYFNQYTEGANANDTWNTLNGTWSISSGRFLGTGGIAYKNVGSLKDFEYTATIVRSAAPDGQTYVLPTDARNLVLFLPLDEGTGTTAYDYSGYRNNGTLNGGPSWITGQFGNATQFNTTNNVTVASSASLNIANEMTVEAWVNIP